MSLIRHELQHVKSYDFLFRQLAFLVLILHCYNPFAYIFFREIIEVQELACDENVMKYISREEQRRYGYLLITTATNEKPNMKSGITLMFSRRNRNFFKRRIKRIGVFVKTKYVLNISMVILIKTSILFEIFSCVFVYCRKNLHML